MGGGALPLSYCFIYVRGGGRTLLCDTHFIYREHSFGFGQSL